MHRVLCSAALRCPLRGSAPLCAALRCAALRCAALLCSNQTRARGQLTRSPAAQVHGSKKWRVWEPDPAVGQPVLPLKDQVLATPLAQHAASVALLKVGLNSAPLWRRLSHSAPPLWRY